jgi:hypothetical protein
VILNPAGVPGTSSDVKPLTNSAGAVVAYQALNPNAEYIRAQVGALANAGRNILATPRVDNVVFGIGKNIRFRERWGLSFRADLYNALNHPQYTLGRINDVASRNTSTGYSQNPFIPGNPAFAQWSTQFSSNPRYAIVSAKLIF